MIYEDNVNRRCSGTKANDVMHSKQLSSKCKFEHFVLIQLRMPKWMTMQLERFLLALMSEGEKQSDPGFSLWNLPEQCEECGCITLDKALLTFLKQTSLDMLPVSVKELLLKQSLRITWFSGPLKSYLNIVLRIQHNWCLSILWHIITQN